MCTEKDCDHNMHILDLKKITKRWKMQLPILEYWMSPNDTIWGNRKLLNQNQESESRIKEENEMS